MNSPFVNLFSGLLSQGQAQPEQDVLDNIVEVILEANLKELAYDKKFESWFLAEFRAETGLPRIVGRIPLKILRLAAGKTDEWLKNSAEKSLGQVERHLLKNAFVRSKLQKCLGFLQKAKDEQPWTQQQSTHAATQSDFDELRDWIEENKAQLQGITGPLDEIIAHQRKYNSLLKLEGGENLEQAPIDDLKSLKWLTPDRRGIRFQGREAEIKALNEFAYSQDEFKIWVVTGPSGAGKTRLASEWMQRNQSFWYAGFSIPGQTGWDQWIPFDNTFIVVDYVHMSRDFVPRLINRVSQLHRDKLLQFQIRLLILDHRFDFQHLMDGQDQWQPVLGSGTTKRSFEDQLFNQDPLELTTSTDGRQDMLRLIMSDVAGPKVKDEDLQQGMDWMEQTENASFPLFAALLGFNLRFGSTVDKLTRRHVILQALKQSRRLLWQLHEEGPVNSIASSFVCLATCHEHAPLEARDDLLFEQEKNMDGPLRLNTVNKAEFVVGSGLVDDNLTAFRPDILGETFVLEFFRTRAMSQERKTLLLEVIFSDYGVKQFSALNEFFRRTTLNLCNDFEAGDKTFKTLWLSLLSEFKPTSKVAQGLVTNGLAALCRFTVSNAFAARELKTEAEQALSGLDTAGLASGLNAAFDALNQEHDTAIWQISRQLAVTTLQADNGPLLSMVLDVLEETALAPAELATEIFVAAGYFGHDGAIQRLIAAGADVNQGTTDDGFTALMYASQNGHTDCVAQLIAVGAEVNQATTDNGFTALMSASQQGHAACVAQLMAAGAKVNQGKTDDGWTALMSASQEGHADCVAQLIAAGADVNQATTDVGFTALMAASQNGHADCVAELITAGADVNQARTDGGATALMAASQQGHAECIAQLITAGAQVNHGMTDVGFTALMAASENGHADCVAQLIAAGADVNQGTTDNGATALMAASHQGHAECVTQLIAAGADVNQGKTDNGATALMFASLRGHTNCVVQLITAGADVNQGATDNGFTALMFASQQGHADCVAQLIAAGADVNQGITDSGATALMFASKNGHTDCVTQLIAAGADVNQGTANGQTALMFASRQGHADCVVQLIAAGADVNQVMSDEDGFTALKAARAQSHTEVVALLIAAGATDGEAER